MIKIKYIEASGEQHELQAASGQSVMEVAIANNIPGIDADCGGQCACGTCHVYIDFPWIEALPPASSNEQEMISFAACAGPTSRLACQLVLDDSHDGIVVRLPEAQH